MGQPENEGSSAATPGKTEREGVAAPLQIGDMALDRYRITAVIEEAQPYVRYEADDTCRCAYCGFESVESLEWCDQCGTRWGVTEGCELTAWLDQAAVPPTVQTITTDGALFSVSTPPPVASQAGPDTPQTAGETSVPTEWRALRHLEVGQATDVGRIRERDEDSVLTFTLTGEWSPAPGPVAGCFIVADGMGGIDAGEIASRMVVQAIGEVVLREVWPQVVRGEALDPDDLVRTIRRGIQDAHSRVLEECQSRGQDMGSTVTLAVVIGDQAVIANVGDSRTYLWRAGQLHRVTQDHSYVAELVARGEIAADDVYTHPKRNIITRSIGDRAPLVRADVFVMPVAAGDNLVLCCDGLWEMVRDPQIAEIVGRLSAQQACEELVAMANANGGEDNISVIVIAAS